MAYPNTVNVIPTKLQSNLKNVCTFLENKRFILLNAKTLIPILGFLFIPFLSLSQTDPCLTYLKDANLKSEQGWYDQAIELAQKSLMDCDLDKNDKISAYRLLIQNYIEIDNLEEAAKAASEIMKLNPNYEADKLVDSPEIISLFERYKPTAVLSGTLYGGLNFSSAQASKTYSVVADNDTEGLDNYENVTGFQVGLGIEYKIFNSLWLASGIQYRNSTYKIQIPNIEGRTVSYEEDLNYLDIPVNAKYYFLKGTIKPFVNAGLNFSFLNSALGNLSRDEVSDIVDRISQRNSLNLGYGIGIGLSYKKKGLGVQLAINYLVNPSNLNKEGTRYENLDLIFKYYYLDNDFVLNNFQVNLGISYDLVFKNVLTKE